MLIKVKNKNERCRKFETEILACIIFYFACDFIVKWNLNNVIQFQLASCHIFASLWKEIEISIHL